MAVILCRRVKIWSVLVKETVLKEFPWVYGTNASTVLKRDDFSPNLE